MAARRMFAKSIVESARFLKMPGTSQNLYFHLCLNADDDGIVEAYSVINIIKASEDDLKVLEAKRFVKVLNADLVTYIIDWLEHNNLRPDRKKDSIYQDLLREILPDVKLLEKKERSDLKKSGLPVDGQWTVRRQSTDGQRTTHGQPTDSLRTTQYSISKDSSGKDRLAEGSTDPVTQETQTPLFSLDGEYLTREEYEGLVHNFPQSVVDRMIKKIIAKPYHG